MKSFFDIQAQYQVRKNEFNQAMQAVLDSGKFIMGPQVKELESALEKYTGAKHCIACANGTDALQLALMAIGIQPGDEVITTPFTFVATAEAIALLGATPIFVDIEPDTYLIDAALIEEKITEKTKAIIPVSLYGQIPDMDAINAIAEQAESKFGHRVYVIEDAAQSFGAEYKGKKSCNVSEIATTSFFPTKPLGCFGDGGALFTNNDELAEKLRQIRVHGQSARYTHTSIGVNSRLDTLQAAVLLVKLKYLDSDLQIRRDIVQAYNAEYADVSGVKTPVEKNSCKHVYGQYTLCVEDREAFVANLKAQGVPTAVHYPIPLNKQPAYLTEQPCPIAEELSGKVVCLPMCLVERK